MIYIKSCMIYIKSVLQVWQLISECMKILRYIRESDNGLCTH